MFSNEETRATYNQFMNDIHLCRKFLHCKNVFEIEELYLSVASEREIKECINMIKFEQLLAIVLD